MSVAIYHTRKISTKQIEKQVQSEAKVANKYIEDIESKFEYALFNAPPELSYLELYIHFLKMWERVTTHAVKTHRFKLIVINRDHFKELYQPRV